MLLKILQILILKVTWTTTIIQYDFAVLAVDKFTEEKKAQALSGTGCHYNPNPEFPLVWKKERWYTYSQSETVNLFFFLSIKVRYKYIDIN